ncbi:unnamed protein product, partial [Menidia menidia]
MAIQQFMTSFVAMRKVSGKYECIMCIKKSSPALQRRTWIDVKYFVHNEILKIKDSPVETKGKIPWTQQEKMAVQPFMTSFVAMRKVPEKYECIMCIKKSSPALQQRTWIDDDMDEPDLGDASVVVLTTISDDATSPVHYHPVRVSVVLQGDVIVNLPRLADAFLIRDHAVTTDLWTEERTNTHYITVTVHYILDWKMVNRILATREMEGVKSSDHIRSTVEGILQEFGILSTDTAFVTDNGS